MLPFFSETFTVRSQADELVLKSGRKYQGLVIEKDDQSVLFEAVFPNGRKGQMSIPTSMIETLTITGKAPDIPVTPAPVEPAKKPDPPATPNPPPAEPPDPPTSGPPPSTSETVPAPAVAGRTESQIQAAIRSAGATPPEWWDSVKLNYPSTLDLTGKNRVTGWQPQKNLGAYIWSVAIPNPSRWRETIRLLHHVLTVRKDDPPRLAEAINQLGKAYLKFEKDYARAAFWYEKSLDISDQAGAEVIVNLAECYWRLGSKSMALSLLKRYQLDRSPANGSIKLLSEMGEEVLALKLADEMVRQGYADEGYILAGNIYRLSRRHAEALQSYQKVLAASQGSRKIQRNQQRARECIEALKLYDALDLSRVPDGAYRGSSVGYRGPIQVEVTVRSGRIAGVRVVQHKEDVYFTSLMDVPRQIVDTQGVKGIDAVSGATITSEAIVNAAAKALSSAMR